METYQDQVYRNYVKELEDSINNGNLEKAMQCVNILSQNLISIEAEVIGVVVPSKPAPVPQAPPPNPYQNPYHNPPMYPNNNYISQNISMNMTKIVPQPAGQGQSPLIRGVIQPPGFFANQNPNNPTIANPLYNAQGTMPIGNLPRQVNVPFNGHPTVFINPPQNGQTFIFKKK